MTVLASPRTHARTHARTQCCCCCCVSEPRLLTESRWDEACCRRRRRPSARLPDRWVGGWVGGDRRLWESRGSLARASEPGAGRQSTASQCSAAGGALSPFLGLQIAMTTTFDNDGRSVCLSVCLSVCRRLSPLLHCDDVRVAQAYLGGCGWQAGVFVAACCRCRWGPARARPRSVAIWLILPVVICLSQRLSHACLSINLSTVKPRMAHYIGYGSLDLTNPTRITVVILELIRDTKA